MRKRTDRFLMIFRGRFIFPVMKVTSYLRRGTRISPKGLEEGDNISITFTGLVQESSPARIQEVLMVQLLLMILRTDKK